MAAAADGPVGARRHQIGQAAQLLGRGGAVGVDEADEVGVGPGRGAEALAQGPALAELGELEEPDARVLGGVAADDVEGAVLAPVQGDPEADVIGGQGFAVGAQRPVDPVLLVVGRQNEVESQGGLLGAKTERTARRGKSAHHCRNRTVMSGEEHANPC